MVMNIRVPSHAGSSFSRTPFHAVVQQQTLVTTTLATQSKVGYMYPSSSKHLLVFILLYYRNVIQIPRNIV